MENLEKLNFKFIFEDNYNPKYINGAYGGISARGEIIIHFYVERPALPNQMSFKIENGMISDEIEEDREPKDNKYSFVRFIENGILMDYSVAKELQNWLNNKIVELEEKLGINEIKDTTTNE